MITLVILLSFYSDYVTSMNRKTLNNTNKTYAEWYNERHKSEVKRNASCIERISVFPCTNHFFFASETDEYIQVKIKK